MSHSQTDRADALAGVEARLRPLGEVTEDLEGVSGTALVGVDPVFSYRGRQRQNQVENLNSSGFSLAKHIWFIPKVVVFKWASSS